jgi:hypothetical protein
MLVHALVPVNSGDFGAARARPLVQVVQPFHLPLIQSFSVLRCSCENKNRIKNVLHDGVLSSARKGDPFYFRREGEIDTPHHFKSMAAHYLSKKSPSQAPARPYLAVGDCKRCATSPINILGPTTFRANTARPGPSWRKRNDFLTFFFSKIYGLNYFWQNYMVLPHSTVATASAVSHGDRVQSVFKNL